MKRKLQHSRGYKLVTVIFVAVILVGVLGAARPVLANETPDMTDKEFCAFLAQVGGESGTALAAAFQDFLDIYGGSTFKGANTSYLVYLGEFQGHKIFWKLSVGDKVAPPDLFEFTLRLYSPDCVAEPVAPAIFLSDVCEPNNGFSSDGWQTWNTDTPGAKLYYGASADGPWSTLEINGAPWALSEANLTAMASAAGLTSYDDLWVKAGETGNPVNVGSAIRDRAAHMDALCGE